MEIEVLNIPPTNESPEINFNPNKGIFLIRGKSIMTNALRFYEPIFDWINNSVKEIKYDITFTIEFEYFNTVSSKCILDILTLIDSFENCSIEFLDDKGNDLMDEFGK